LFLSSTPSLNIFCKFILDNPRIRSWLWFHNLPCLLSYISWNNKFNPWCQ
jgi:hypothetical protein